MERSGVGAVRMPGEWEPHLATIVAWPGRPEVWAGYEGLAAAEYRCLIRTIAEDEPVLVLWDGVEDEFGPPPTGGGIRVFDVITDDAWIRDSSPLWGLSTSGDVLGIDFKFNSWGERFTPFENDARVGGELGRRLGIDVVSVPFVLEGGAVSFNGDGVALVVEECVLHSSRNGFTSRSDFERVLGDACGIKEVIWLPFGLLEDMANTDGHVDNVAVFAGPRRVIVQGVPDSDPNAERLRENLTVLSRHRLADGSVLELEVIEELDHVEHHDGVRRPSPFLNFVVTSASIIVPVVGRGPSTMTRTSLESAFPGRVVKTSPSVALTFGGGGPHCVTMQVPAASPVKSRVR